MRKNYYFEVAAFDSMGFKKYYYFKSKRHIEQHIGQQLPLALLLYIEDHEDKVIHVKELNVFEYIKRKYIQNYFANGERIDWEVKTY